MSSLHPAQLEPIVCPIVFDAHEFRVVEKT